MKETFAVFCFCKRTEKRLLRFWVNNMQLYVKTLTGKTIEISNVDQNTNTVTDIKKQIEISEGIPVNQQRLVYAGKQLEDGKVLSNYKIQPGMIYH